MEKKWINKFLFVWKIHPYALVPFFFENTESYKTSSFLLVQNEFP